MSSLSTKITSHCVQCLEFLFASNTKSQLTAYLSNIRCKRGNWCIYAIRACHETAHTSERKWKVCLHHYYIRAWIKLRHISGYSAMLYAIII